MTGTEPIRDLASDVRAAAQRLGRILDEDDEDWAGTLAAGSDLGELREKEQHHRMLERAYFALHGVADHLGFYVERIEDGTPWPSEPRGDLS
jgi:hypothetical protein